MMVASGLPSRLAAAGLLGFAFLEFSLPHERYRLNLPVRAHEIV
jgi:hypothetical protein